ncbi:MAG: ABC transporter ATP-binding protein [Alphaproteobacteria bacterium]|nr:ABC transporter ATP-binding protein [Alphaproteobacteria bacterium]
MTGPTPLLATEHLAKRFGGVIATDDVSVTVEAGDLQCIIGPNGAGKSTLFSLLCGIQHPDAGRILFKGEDITRLPPFARVRKGLGLTFQTNRSFVELDVSQNLAIPMAAMRAARGAEAEERYRYAQDLFGLAEDDPTPVRELAHDRRQWLEMLMVLAGGPELLLLDEPTAGMSPDETSQTAKVLHHLNATGLTIIVVEHDIAFVREVARRVTVLHQGRVFADGALDEIAGRQDVRDIYLGRA